MRLTLQLVKKQQSLILATIERCLVIVVVWMMFVFYLGKGMVTEGSSFCLDPSWPGSLGCWMSRALDVKGCWMSRAAILSF